MEIYIAQETRWTMACKQTLTALNWVKVVHLARERCLAIKDAWMVEAMWCDGLSARSSPELQVEKITKLNRGRYRFLMRMAAIVSLSTIHWLLYASWLGVSCIGFCHKPLGLCMYIYKYTFSSYVFIHRLSIYPSKRSASDLSLCAFRFYKRFQLLWNLWR